MSAIFDANTPGEFEQALTHAHNQILSGTGFAPYECEVYTTHRVLARMPYPGAPPVRAQVMRMSVVVRDEIRRRAEIGQWSQEKADRVLAILYPSTNR